jgi:hypothetical protein
VNEALQQSIDQRDAFSSVALRRHGRGSCERPVNPGEMAKALARIRRLWGEGIASLQQSMKLAEELGVAEVRRSSMIAGGL